MPGILLGDSPRSTNVVHFPGCTTGAPSHSQDDSSHSRPGVVSSRATAHAWPLQAWASGPQRLHACAPQPQPRPESHGLPGNMPTPTSF
ncbi:hypothetical protein ASPCADRAFT_210922 [Aspergillus carbonarius ITEM 5010]|uniref:Uncharacterized protein n=1 Tax=Aspergillus carbonarius (strain ITEM 5010) TaxID=602072 RepID=A0A1R3RAQ3_ASPC5|nr:hypothetical protein ASPCADRAFT_210922 [Aspergillus carbonarius ITEM 5010]